MLRFLMTTLVWIAVASSSMSRAEEKPANRKNSSVISAPTNSLQAGIVMDNPDGVIHIRSGKMLTSIYFVVVNSSSNRVIYFAPRNPRERLELGMIDLTGKPVPLTKQGKQFGAKSSIPLGTPSLNWNHYALLRSSVPPQDEYAFSLESFSDKEYNFDWKTTLLECFQPLGPGNYKLQMAQRLYFSDEKGILQSTSFSIIVPLKVEDSHK